MSETPPSWPGAAVPATLYVNGARIDFTRWDVTVDLLLVTPAGEIPVEPGKEPAYTTERMTRVVMSPMHAKALAETLAEAVQAWESRFGALPTEGSQ